MISPDASPSRRWFSLQPSQVRVAIVSPSLCPVVAVLSHNHQGYVAFDPPRARSGGGCWFFFVLLLCVGANRRFSGSGPWRTMGAGGFWRRCCQNQIYKTRLEFLQPGRRPALVMVVARHVHVVRSCSACDQHAPGDFSPWPCACGSPFASPVSNGDDLDS